MSAEGSVADLQPLFCLSVVVNEEEENRVYHHSEEFLNKFKKLFNFLFPPPPTPPTFPFLPHLPTPPPFSYDENNVNLAISSAKPP